MEKAVVWGGKSQVRDRRRRKTLPKSERRKDKNAQEKSVRPTGSLREPGHGAPLSAKGKLDRVEVLQPAHRPLAGLVGAVVGIVKTIIIEQHKIGVPQFVVFVVPVARACGLAGGRWVKTRALEPLSGWSSSLSLF